MGNEIRRNVMKEGNICCGFIRRHCEEKHIKEYTGRDKIVRKYDKNTSTVTAIENKNAQIKRNKK
jgi:hypothetical protein